jgi:ABC-type Fe3+ transport system substrate-binding protein
VKPSVAVIVLLALAVACGPAAAAPRSSTASAPASTPPEAPRNASPSATAGGAAPPAAGDAAAWTRLQEAARREGTVVLAGPPFPGLRQAFSEAFQRAYGITIEYLSLPSGEAIARIDREFHAAKPTIDLYMGGPQSCWLIAERGEAENAATLLVDPALFDAAVWRDGAPRLVKAPPNAPADLSCGVQGSDWVMTDLFVNSEVVDPASIRSWKDLLQPQFKGKIASHDPRTPGSGAATVSYLYKLFGEQYLRDLYVGQQVTNTADYRQLAEWVARGTYPVGIALVQANVEPLRASGLPLQRVFPDDGPGATLGGFSLMTEIKNGPNPDAATVFMNWFLSREAQEIWEREMMETSLRTDVSHQVPDYVIRKPGVQYIDGYDPDFYYSVRAPSDAKIQEILGR